jgi:hypothetical protein
MRELADEYLFFHYLLISNWCSGMGKQMGRIERGVLSWSVFCKAETQTLSQAAMCFKIISLVFISGLYPAVRGLWGWLLMCLVEM